MKITEIRSAVVVVPLARPVAWATAAVTEREYILVWAIAEDGTYGLGYGLGSRYPGGAKIIHDIVVDQLAGEAIGTDSWMTEALWDKLYRRTLLLGRRGAALQGNKRPGHRIVGSQCQARRPSALSPARRLSATKSRYMPRAAIIQATIT